MAYGTVNVPGVSGPEFEDVKTTLNTTVSYSVCTTAAATVTKTVSITNFKLVTGVKVVVKFTYTNTASSPKLNVGGTGAKLIMHKGFGVPKNYLSAGNVYEFVYDGSYWQLIGDNECGTDVYNVTGDISKTTINSTNYPGIKSFRFAPMTYSNLSQESKQEKPFTEVIVQVGDKNTMGVETECCELATKILDEYMQGFKERNPNLYVFSAHMHLDEATPHLHIDFVPFITGSKRGLETRVSLKGALETLGFKGGSWSNTELNQWRNSEKEVLAKIMLEHGIEWDEKGTHEKHKSVSEFKKQKLIEEVENLQEEKSEIEQKISAYKSAEDYARATAAKLEDEEYKIPEPPPLMSAKAYKTKFVEPLIKKLIGIIKTLARKCYTAEKETERVTKKMTELYQEKEILKSANWDLRMANSKMGVEVRNFKKIKYFLGVDKVQEMLKNISKSKNRSDISK